MNGLPEPREEAGGAPPVPPAPGLKQTLVSSAKWTMIGYSLSQVLRLVSMIVVARLLDPQDVGLMGIVFLFITGLNLFSNLGIGPSIVQSKRGDDPVFMNTAWTLQIVRGLALWLATVVIAWPVALFCDEDPYQALALQVADYVGLAGSPFGQGPFLAASAVVPRRLQPSLLWLLPAVGLATAISGFSSTGPYVLERRLAQRRRVLFDLGISVVNLAFTAACAWTFRSVWVLVASNLMAALLGTLCSHWMVPEVRNRLCWDRTALKELLHFSSWVLFGSVFTFVGDKTDQFVIFKLKGSAIFGVYYISLRLLQVPMELMSSVNNALVFPLYSRVIQGGRSQREAFLHIHLAPAGLAALLIAGLIVTGPTFVRIVFDQRYEDAAWMVPLLAAGAWFQILEHTEDSFLWAFGQSRVSALSNAAKVLSLPVLAPLGYWLGSLADSPLEGLIVGFVSTQLVRYVVTAAYIHRLGMPVFRWDLVLTVLVGATAALGWYSGTLLWPERTSRDLLRLWLQFGTQGLVVVLCWAALFGAAWSRGLIRTTWRSVS
jgi:O-antigen/teichoic acid export membrane protein